MPQNRQGEIVSEWLPRFSKAGRKRSANSESVFMEARSPARVAVLHLPSLTLFSMPFMLDFCFLENRLFRVFFRGSSRYGVGRRGVPDVHRNSRTGTASH